MDFPPCPASLKQIQHFLKIAQEHDTRDIVVAYWSRLYALQVGLKLSTHQPDETKLLLSIMDWLETVKKEHASNEAITNEVVAQAHMENYALRLFLYADKQDRDSNFGKNVVKAFYSSGVIYDVMQTFGDLTDEATHNRKYAKWKAAYIHNCLKNGETPVPGPLPDGEEDINDVGGEGTEGGEAAGGGSGGGNTPPPQTPPEQNPSPAATPPSPPSTNDADPNGGFDPASVPSPTNVTPPTADEVLNNPSKLPSPPVEEEKPGGFVPYVPAAQPTQIWTPPVPVADLNITPDQMIKAQKYCKYAGSALNYDDVKTAIENLQKALTLLTTGRDV